MFGFGAKTSPYSQQTCSIFPLSRSLRNPFIPNDSNVIDQAYTDCLHSLELSVPINVTPMIESILNLGKHIRKNLEKKAKKINHDIARTIDCFYVVYVLFTGVVDDIQELVRLLHNEDLSKLPI
jgi:hypothetical protein